MPIKAWPRQAFCYLFGGCHCFQELYGRIVIAPDSRAYASLTVWRAKMDVRNIGRWHTYDIGTFGASA